MAISIGGKTLKSAYIGDTPIKAIYVGSRQVWSSKPVVTISGIDSAQFQLRDAIRAYGLDYRTVTELPFLLDTSQVTNMENMFKDCSALTSVPDLDTSKVTVMYSMFENCSALTDGKVRLIRPDGTKPPNRANMIWNSGLTREPFFLPDGTPID